MALVMVDREKEKARLDRPPSRLRSSVVLRGRRRVGKSDPLDHSFAGRRFVYFQADEGEERDHLDLLAAEVRALVGAPLSFADWDTALDYLGSLAKDAPLVVALDDTNGCARLSRGGFDHRAPHRSLGACGAPAHAGAER